MKVVVTGTAGFIGSHLSERLATRGDWVVGIDSFSDYYEESAKKANIVSLRKLRAFRLVRADLSTYKVERLLQDADVVFHLAAQPGVRGSWGSGFSHYVRDNVVATQRLLEAAAKSKVRRFVYSSSSSIYGDAEQLPTPESVTPRPVSPYGATKLLGEHLCNLYHSNRGLSTVVLRYFTVYGPRQRPDMAFHRFIEAALKGVPVTIFGNGRQRRDFTYVSDIVDATLSAAEAEPGTTFNVGGGQTHELIDAIGIISDALGREPKMEFKEVAEGDVRSTSAGIDLIEKQLGWRPQVNLKGGLRRQVEWHLARAKAR